MAIRRNYFRCLMASSTILGLAFGGINESYGAAQISLFNPSYLSNATNWSSGPFVSGDNIKLGGNHQIISDQPGNYIDYIDTNGYSNGSFTIQSPIDVGGILSIGNAGGNNGTTPLEFSNNVTLVLGGNSPYARNYSGIKIIAPSVALGSGNGFVNFNILEGNAQEVSFDLGTPALKLDKIRSTAIQVVTHDSVKVILKNGKKIYADEYQLTDTSTSNSYFQDNILELEDDTIVDAKIVTARRPLQSGSGARGGRLIVKGSTILTQDIGTYNDPLLEVNFIGNTPTKKVFLYGDIVSDSIFIGQPTLTIESDLILNSGEVVGDNSTVNLKSNTLTFTYDTIISSYYSSSPVSFTNDLTLNTTAGDMRFGRIVVDNSQVLFDMDETDHLHINLTDSTTTLPGPGGRVYVMLGTVTNNGAINIIPDNRVTFLRLPGGNPFVNWSYSNGVLTQTSKTAAEINQIIQDMIAAAGGDNTTVTNGGSLANLNNAGQAGSLANDLITIAITDPATLLDAINRLEPVIVEATEASYTSAAEAVRTVSERISSVSSPSKFRLAEADIGLAAGDELSKHGSWGSVYYSTATQKGSKKAPGYRSRTYGCTVGADTKLNDTVMLGLAVSAMNVHIKHKDSNTGDTTKTTGYLFSLYGLKELSPEWFVQAVLSVGTNKIDNKEQRQRLNTYETARGKYTVSNYGTEIVTGYEYTINNNLLLTPMAGIAYNRISDSWYQETGTTNQNLLITKKADQKVEAIGGARLTTSRDWNGTVIIPEVHGMIRYDMLNMSPKVDVRLDGLVNRLVPRTKESNRAVFNLGCGINMAKGNLEYGLTYDGYLANKYLGHQGTLKLRLNF